MIKEIAKLTILIIIAGVGIYLLFFMQSSSEVVVNKIITEVQAIEEEPFVYKPITIIIPKLEITKPNGIYIDLEKMELELWNDGESTIYPVGAIRKGFNKYNTPTGEFTALYKTENHLSSLFDVWMPYSIQFYGDYFIHGYPTYNDAERTLVPYGNSGGCIRMSTEDMKEIFEFLEIGMPIIIK